MNSDKDTDSDLSLSIKGPFTDEHRRVFRERPHFDEIHISDQDLITVDIARQLVPIRSVRRFSVWCKITRAAMRHVISLPNLEDLIVFELKPSGQLAGFKDAGDITQFSCLYGLNEAELIEVANLPCLQQLRAQHSNVTRKALKALLASPKLAKVDFEDSNFDDDLVGLLAQSNTITEVEIGDNRITRAGLEQICTMEQLKAIDIWSIDIAEPDLDMLAALPNLEYLSIGGNDDQTVFTIEGTLPKLEKIQSLKEIWLDGFHVTREQWGELNSRYEKVRVTAVTDD